MAREQRHDVDYFPHPCTHGRKMYIIETKYGNDGYAVWMKLLEQLGAANDHFLDVSDEMNFMYLTSIFKVDYEVAKNILQDLAKLGAIDQHLYENHQVIFSEKFVDSVKDAYRKRKSEVVEYSDILERFESKNNQSGGSNKETGGSTPEVGRKEKKRKEKERKEERKTREGFEKISSSYELIKKEKPDQLSTFEMQKKIQVLDWKKVTESFDTKMELEISQDKIEFDSEQLFPRFKGYVNTWIDNDHKKLETKNHGATESKPEYF